MTQGDDRPQWPLSAYGPGRDAPRQLLEAPLEQSFEELRVLYYLAKAGGSTSQYEQNERSAVDQANQRAQQILNDIDGALKYIIDGKDQHPNRDEQTQKSAGNFNWSTRPSFNQTAATSSTGTAFGQSSTLGASSTSAFGKPSTPGFGQASTLASTTPFGRSSAAGTTAFGAGQTTSTSAFGRPSPLGGGGGGGATAFGQPSNLGGGSTAFGKPSGLAPASTFGAQSTSNTSPFGQAPSNTGASPFGQPSNTTSGSAFGQASNPGGSTAFGQPSAPGSSTALGKPSPFGAAASSAPAFGSSTPFGAQAPSTTSAFGQPSQPTQQSSPFGQPSQPGQQSSPFGQPSQPSQQSSPFAKAAQQAPQQSAFGKPTSFGSSGGTTSTFGQPAFGSSTTFGAASGTSAFGNPSAPSQQPAAFGSGGVTANGPTAALGSQAQPQNPPFGRQTSTASGQRITAFKGRPVTYQRLEKIQGKIEDKKEYPFYHNPSTNKLERIWLPEGPPGPNPDVEASPETYEVLGAALKQLYDFVRDSGTFKDGLVPEVPPKREWVNWEL